MTPKNFTKLKLKNGITVIHEERNLPIVSLSITNRFGASFEESSRNVSTGVSQPCRFASEARARLFPAIFKNSLRFIKFFEILAIKMFLL